MKWHSVLMTLLLLIALVLASCGPVATPTPESEVQERLAEVLRDDVLEFQVVELDAEALAKGLEGEAIVLPLVNQEGEIVELEMAARPVQLRADELTTGIVKSGDLENPDVEEVPLPREQNYVLGECWREEMRARAAELGKASVSCGALTILDMELTMFRGMVVHPDVGVSFFEPVSLVLGGREFPGSHILYNWEHTTQVVFPEDEEPRSSAEVGAVPGQALGMVRPLGDLTLRSTSIVLDGDVKFYNIDKATVWARQESVHVCVWILYVFIEPFSSADWALDLTIKGQEVWVSGGPTSTSGSELIADITDANYFLLNPITNDELHYLFVGYDVIGLYGMAAGIGTGTGGLGGASGNNHAFGEARSNQSLKKRWVVMAHEVGHLLGGKHGDGDASGTGCAGGLFSSLCGISIMCGGGAGGPDTRAAYFSDANDDNVVKVLKTLP